ncbi:MAG: hypothetical protein LAO31_02155 [Acidobacteriia bacterium]|nr:hypothetical protein [Terriglobia bacterium]
MNLLFALVIALVIQAPNSGQNSASPIKNNPTPNPVILSIGAAEGDVPPLSGGIVGQRTVRFTVTFENTSKKSIWIDAYTPDKPTYHIETRGNAAEEWKPYFLGWCGVGLKKFEIHPKTSHHFTVLIDEKYLRNELRVHVYYYANLAGAIVKRAVSRPWVIPDLKTQSSLRVNSPA